VKGAALLCSKVVAAIIGNEVDHRAVGQSRGLVDENATVLDAGAKRTHNGTIRVLARPRKRALLMLTKLFVNGIVRHAAADRCAQQQDRLASALLTNPGSVRACNLVHKLVENSSQLPALRGVQSGETRPV